MHKMVQKEDLIRTLTKRIMKKYKRFYTDEVCDNEDVLEKLEVLIMKFVRHYYENLDEDLSLVNGRDVLKFIII